ncbi:hypothetical protein BSFA1_67710 (plasmid) [Burkholderia sp. SFA1]|nr:hypothetical protein BSFA1_67710 [Burkholderia sp. SFA1]
MTRIRQQRQRTGNHAAGNFDQHEYRNDHEGPADAPLVAHAMQMVMAGMTMTMTVLMVMALVAMVVSVLVRVLGCHWRVP